MNIRTLRSAALLLTLPLAALASLSARAATHDAAADFDSAGGATGVTGVWQYGYDSTATEAYDFQPFDRFTVYATGQGWGDSQYASLGTPTIWYAESGYQHLGVPDGWLALHPGPNSVTSHSDAAILRFTAPRAGHYQVTATTLVGDGGQTESWVVHNGNFGTPWMSRGLDGADLTTVGSLHLQAGDTLDLAVGSFGSFLFDTTPVQFTLTSTVPEPTPAALLAAGLAAGLVVRARRCRQARGR